MREVRLEVIGYKDGKEETILDQRLKAITQDLPVSGYDSVMIRVGEKGSGTSEWVVFDDSYFI